MCLRSLSWLFLTVSKTNVDKCKKGLSRLLEVRYNLALVVWTPLQFRLFTVIILDFAKEFGVTMARVCQVTGKRPVSGNKISHANNKTKRRFLPNLQNRKFWVESENRWVRLRLTNNALRTIDKNGIDSVLADLRARGEI